MVRQHRAQLVGAPMDLDEKVCLQIFSRHKRDRQKVGESGGLAPAFFALLIRRHHGPVSDTCFKV